jgi:hypothetical protein
VSTPTSQSVAWHRLQRRKRAEHRRAGTAIGGEPDAFIALEAELDTLFGRGELASARLIDFAPTVARLARARARRRQTAGR